MPPKDPSLPSFRLAPYRWLQAWSGRRRMSAALRSRSANTASLDGFGESRAYCERLLQIYNQMRSDSEAERRSKLLSHVPEWARSLGIEGSSTQPDEQAGTQPPSGSDPTPQRLEPDILFSIDTLLTTPRLQAALANCTSYTPSKWLLEREMMQRVSNRRVAAIRQELSDAEASGSRAATAQQEPSLPESLKHPPKTPTTVCEWLLEEANIAAEARGDDPLSADAAVLRQRYTAATRRMTKLSDAQWERELAFAKTVRLRVQSEGSIALPAGPEDVVERYRRWQLGADSDVVSWEPNSSRDIYDVAADERLAGLALSGGGIRSATFCLGILQSLAAHDRLRSFDYLSSVSGGGYIHQWFAAWIHREPLGLASVQSKMQPLPGGRSMARAPEQINWLRRYSSYLTPRRGLLSGDTWTMLAIWFRNTFLNQIVLLSFFATMLVLIRAVMHPFTMARFLDSHSSALSLPILVNDVWQRCFACATVICVLWATWGAGTLWRALASVTKEPGPGGQPPEGAIGNAAVVSLIVAPGFLLSILTALAAADVFRLHDVFKSRLDGLHSFYASYFGAVHLLLVMWALYIAALLVAVTFGGDALATANKNHPAGSTFRRLVGFVASIVLCTAIPVGLVVAASTHGSPDKGAWAAAIRLATRLDNRFSPAPTKAGPDVGPPGCACCCAQNSAAKAPPPACTCNCCAQAATAKGGAAATSATTHPSPKILKLAGALLALFAPLVFFFAQILAIRLHVGLLGRAYEESRREWLARYGAWTGIFALSWFSLGVIALVGPILCQWAFGGTAAHKIISSVVVVAVHAVTLYAGSSSKSSGAPDPRKFFGYSALDLAGIVGAPLAILILLLLTSGAVDYATGQAWQLTFTKWGHSPWPPLASPFGHAHAFLQYLLAVSGPVVAFFLYVATLGLFGTRVDVNEFSMHPFYRDRLARCYVGASNGKRVADPFTGFDDHSEISYGSIALAELLPARFGGKPKPEGSSRKQHPPYDGPMPIFCSTVNLTFGQDLAFQDRKGASFAFTPLYTGYHVNSTAESQSSTTTTYNGFVPTRHFAYRGQAMPDAQGSIPTPTSGIALTTCAAVSGAALSPNQGFNSQPMLAFLMTLFNVRLGWWLANPRKPYIWPNGLDQPTPRFGLRYLLAELFGYTNDTSNYVALSDGGFFDNMGLYELVRRRCSTIVICDGEADENTTFEGLGLAVTKARIDFGVEITFPEQALDDLAPNNETGRAARHFARGTIRYPAPPGGDPEDPRFTGDILYLKTAFVGDEPIDIRHYKREHPDFPQESTINQWFTEPQFESYRRLGQLTADLAFGSGS
jgi:hypothetical protein